MKYWEFLIQKEGDETWLPLETQQVEILEGRYRVVAHSDRLNTPMEIKVSQLVTTEMPPRKRVRNRLSETNDAGLVVVMPFVYLQPGQWELTCRSPKALEGDASLPAPSTDSWEYTVQLEVFAPTDEDWSSEWPVPEDTETAHSTLIEDASASAASPLPSSSGDTPLVQAQAMLQDNLQRQGQSLHDTIDTSLLDSVYRVSLRQQAFLARRNQAMTITGQVQALSDGLPMQGASQLWLRLQNPETASVIMEAHRPLSLERLPADFKVKIQLPANVKTRVVLGEVSLRTAAIDDDEPAKILSATAFTITAGIAQLIDEVANRDPGTFAEEIAALSGNAETLSAAEPGFEPDLISPILDPTRQSVAPAVGVVLPPKLDRNAAVATANSVDAYAGQSAELPTFPQAQDVYQPLLVSDGPSASDGLNDGPSDPTSPLDSSPQDLADQPLGEPFAPRPSLVSQPAQFMGTSIEDDDLETSQIAALLEDIDGDLASQPADMAALEPPGIEGALPMTSPVLPVRPSEDANAGSDAADATAAETAAESETPSNDFRTQAEIRREQQSKRQTEASMAFKSLKLKDHFWNRLSNLTHEGREEATQLAKNMEAAGVSPTAGMDRPPFGSDWDDAPAANSEVVIYDQPPAADSVQPSANTAPPADETYRPASLPAPSERSPAQGRPPLPDAPRTGAASAGVPFSNKSFSNKSFSTESFSTESFSTGSFSSSSLPPEDFPEMELPVISVPRGDFVAGDTVTVTVRTRPSVYKPFIKLWMVDRQSRSLVGDPKLLTSLTPDALGYLEASADLRVPMGCLDVQIAAIAVDMATQQESNKAVVNRHVVPAGGPPTSNRNFNL
ncbi:MAG: hypothetical protein AAFN12_06270 [Cyanobacteria bacterium J06560_2]